MMLRQNAHLVDASQLRQCSKPNLEGVGVLNFYVAISEYQGNRPGSALGE